MNDMATTTETSESGALDILKLLVAAGALVGGLFCYYYYVEVSLPLRVLMVLGGLALGLGIAMTSTQGRRHATRSLFQRSRTTPEDRSQDPFSLARIRSKAGPLRNVSGGRPLAKPATAFITR